MKIVAAYLLAVLGGNASPSADDLKNILASGTFCPSSIFSSSLREFFSFFHVYQYYKKKEL